MWKPDWLYENMPLLYVLIGALCVWVLGPSVPTVLSLLALATASLLTISVRRDARRCTLRRAESVSARPARTAFRKVGPLAGCA
jgi:hypothetical protein